MAKNKTPWTRVYAAFNMSQADFARALGVSRAKISLALSDGDGLISGKDQVRILNAAAARGIVIPAEDMLPSVGA